MADYDLSEESDLDLADLYEYGIETYGFLGRSYVFQLHDNFKNLAKNPDIGRDASEYTPGLQCYSYKAHAIFFKKVDDSIYIVRTLGQRMDFKIHF